MAEENYIIKGETLTNIANEIRKKKSTTAPIKVEDMATEISEIETGGTGGTEGITELLNLNNGISGMFNANYTSVYVDGKFEDTFPKVASALKEGSIKKMNYAFYGQNKMTEAPDINYEDVTDISSAFNNCKLLADASNVKTSYVCLNWERAFYSDTVLVNGPIIQDDIDYRYSIWQYNNRPDRNYNYLFNTCNNLSTSCGIFDMYAKVYKEHSTDLETYLSKKHFTGDSFYSTFTNCWSTQFPNVVILFSYEYTGTSYSNYAINMNETFRNCYKLKNFYMPCGALGDTTSTFNGCSSLKRFKTGITYGVGTRGNFYKNYMFYNCCNLELVDGVALYFYSTPNYIFQNCYSLKTLVIRNWKSSYQNIGSSCFSNCYHFNGTVDATYNPEGLTDGVIYVPDDYVDTIKSLTNWSVYADLIKPLSEYVEVDSDWYSAECFDGTTDPPTITINDAGECIIYKENAKNIYYRTNKRVYSKASGVDTVNLGVLAAGTIVDAYCSVSDSFSDEATLTIPSDEEE